MFHEKRLMCRQLKIAVLVTAVIAWANPASAALLAYDGFDYAVGGLGGNAGGSGSWTNAWSGTAFSVEASSLTLPNMPFAVVGGHASGAGTTNRDFAGISATVDGTYYLSYLVQRIGFNPDGTSGQWADLHLRTSGWYRSVTGTAASGGLQGIQADSQSLSSVGGDGKTEDPYFYVLKIVVDSAGVDQVYGSVYSDGALIPASEPAAWDYEILNANITADMSKLTFWTGTLAGFTGHYDEIRLATTYVEAVPVPEPASLVVGLFGLIGLSMCRSWRQSA